MNINRSDGWVKLHKKTLHSILFEDDAGYRLFSALLMMAHHKANFASVRFNGKQVYLEPGELSASRSELEALLHWKKDKAKDVLARLIKHGYITSRTDKHTTIITICNWSKYQNVEDDPTEPQQNPNRTSNKTPTKTPTDNRGKRDKSLQQNPNQTTNQKDDIEETSPTNPQPTSVQKKEENRNKEVLGNSMAVAKPDPVKQIEFIIGRQDEKLQQALREFIEYRKTSPSPINTAAKMTHIINRLKKDHPDDVATQIRSLKRSIQNSWISVFPVPDNPKVQAMFDFWNNTTGGELSVNEKSGGNVNACNRLLGRCNGDENKMHQLIQMVAVAQTEKYAPTIGDFVALETKYHSLLAWAKKYYKTNTKANVVDIR